jgi:signal transduction histidine kinase
MRVGGGGRRPVAEWRPVTAARRIGSAPRALTVTGTILAVASFAQASVQAVALASARGSTAHASTSSLALYAVSLCLLALAATVPLIFLRPLAAAVFITTASVLSLAAFGVVTAGNATSGMVTAGLVTAGGAAAQVIAVYRLGAAGPGDSPGAAEHADWRARYLSLGLAAPFLVLALVSQGGMAAVLLAALVPASAGTGIAVRSRRSASLEGMVRSELADTLVEHMARGERARIARELHDVVAHHISMISVQAETARLTVPDLPPEGARRLREISDTARAGLTEMRRLLGVLRSDVDPAAVGERQPQPGLRQLALLIDGSRTASGGGVRLIVSGQVTSFDPGVELAAYRIVQEALTNARRHAPGAAVDVELRYEEDLLRVRVRDNGPGPGPGSTGKGADDGPGARGVPAAGTRHGLLGMRERAATVGGTLRTGEAPGGGFVVEAELPAKPEVAS